MVIFLSFIIFITLYLISYIILNILYRDRINVVLRLTKIKGKENKKEDINELDVSFYQRIIKPFSENLYNFTAKITPSGTKKNIEEKLVKAGNPYGLGVDQWFLIRIILGGGLPVLLFITIIVKDMLFSKASLFVVIIALILNVFPTLLLSSITRKRQSEIVKSLPDVLDLVTVSVQAGLSFDGALSRLVEKMPGALSKEFNRVLHSMRMGKGRSDALREMSERCGVPDLTTLIGSLIQADQLGVGVGSVLRVQSQQMREKRRQRAQEKAMKAPIKILFPLIFFIFPSIFAVLLGPAVISMISMFGGE